MSACDPAANPAQPSPARILTPGEITPEIQAQAALLANSDAAIGLQLKKNMAVRGGKVLPLIFWVSCHSYTQIGDQQIPGRYHGASVYVDLSATADEKQTDWKMVAASGFAVAAVVAGFWYVAKGMRPHRRA